MNLSSNSTLFISSKRSSIEKSTISINPHFSSFNSSCENERTEKKIEVTRRKTVQKQNSLLKQENVLKKKMEFKNRKQAELEAKREQNKKNKRN